MNQYFYDFQPGIVDILPTIARFLNFTIPIESERELDGIPLIGNVSLTNPVIHLNGSALNISWTMLNNIGNVSIWISEKNLFRKGLMDNYTLISTVPIDQQMINIDLDNYSSYFFKIVLEGQFNSVNKWIFRPWYRNQTIS
ncbi:unnamed protein product [Adineta ricciae]|nr:unnamed protein product [Adineta ricciae]